MDIVHLMNQSLLVTQSCLTLCDPMDCSLPGSSLHGIPQIRILEWVAIPFSRGSSQSRDWTRVFLHCRPILYHLSYQGSPKKSRRGEKELKSCFAKPCRKQRFQAMATNSSCHHKKTALTPGLLIKVYNVVCKLLFAKVQTWTRHTPSI